MPNKFISLQAYVNHAIYGPRIRTLSINIADIYFLEREPPMPKKWLKQNGIKSMTKTQIHLKNDGILASPEPFIRLEKRINLELGRP